MQLPPRRLERPVDSNCAQHSNRWMAQTSYNRGLLHLQCPGASVADLHDVSHRDVPQVPEGSSHSEPLCFTANTIIRKKIQEETSTIREGRKTSRVRGLSKVSSPRAKSVASKSISPSAPIAFRSFLERSLYRYSKTFSDGRPVTRYAAFLVILVSS